MSRIDGLRRENGINLVVKVPFKEGLLLCREILPPPDGDVFFSKLWRKLVFPVVLRSREHSEHAAPNFGELLHGRQAVSRSRRRSHLVLTNNVGHADHEEFVKIVVENGEELELFKQRHAQIAGFFEHLAVEFNPIELTVNVEQRIGEVWHAFYGRQRGRRRFERSRTGSGNFDRFDCFYAFRAFDRLRDRLFRRRAAADCGFFDCSVFAFHFSFGRLGVYSCGLDSCGLVGLCGRLFDCGFCTLGLECGSGFAAKGWFV